jgi:CRISPR/Cas system-associated protein Cas10 (large subunit of type III CRISPR-Cas system)
MVKDRSAAVPVITGSYTPLFTPSYSGYAAEVVTDSLASLDKLIASLEDAKMPYYRQLDSNDRELREVLSQGVRKGIFMSDSEYEILIGAREAIKVAARERHTAKKREIEAAIAALTLAQQEARLKQRDVKKAGDDFNALLNLLKSVERSRFWSAEIVQIILNGGGNENMEVGFVPRSGNFTVDLGTATDVDTKLANLYRFYNKGLDKMGWDKYKSISLRYHGQVVCR